MSANDPRADVADEYAHALATLLMDEQEFLRLLDVADRKAGIVRVRLADLRLVLVGSGTVERAEAWLRLIQVVEAGDDQ